MNIIDELRAKRHEPVAGHSDVVRLLEPTALHLEAAIVIEAGEKRIAELEAALRSLHMATLHPDNVLRGAGVREALDRAEELIG